MRLAVVTAYPTRHQARWFRALATEEDIDLDVLYCLGAPTRESVTAPFGVESEWDRRLCDGYAHRFLANRSTVPDVATFNGTDTPELFHLLGNYDAVLVNGWHHRSAWQAIWTCWQRHVPLLVRSDSHLHSSRSSLRRVMKALPYRWFIPRFDACLPVGTWSRDYFLHYGADPHRIFTVPHVVDPPRDWNTLAVDRQTIRARWGLDVTQRVFLFVGTFAPFKRPLDFVRGVATAHTSDRRVAGLMVGDGQTHAECVRLAASIGAPVRFTGLLNQSDVASAYAAADMLILPSESEAWGLVVDEAMNYGVPCLVSNGVGCAPDLVESERVACRFPVGDVKAMSRLMLELVAAPAVMAAMGERASTIARGKLKVAVEGVRAALAATVHRRDVYQVSRGRHHEVAGHG